MAKSKNQAAKNEKAAARIRAAQQQKRQRSQWAIGIVALVVVGIAVLVFAKVSKDDSTESTAAGPAPASVSEDLASVSLEAIAAADAARTEDPAKYSEPQRPNPVQPISDGEARTKDGKPEVLYIGAEFCPYCAGERWSLAVALSKFGEFSDLQTLTSSEGDVPTISFVGATFDSEFVTFRPIELQDQEGEPLEDATDAEMELFQNLGGSSFPFIDFGGMAFQKGGSVGIETLIGKSQTEIAESLAASGPSDVGPKTVEGQVNSIAGEFTRAICDLTDDQPAKVCDAIPAA